MTSARKARQIIETWLEEHGVQDWMCKDSTNPPLVDRVEKAINDAESFYKQECQNLLAALKKTRLAHVRIDEELVLRVANNAIEAHEEQIRRLK